MASLLVDDDPFWQCELEGRELAARDELGIHDLVPDREHDEVRLGHGRDPLSR